MHLYTCKFLLNTLGRAVEQLTGCLPKQSKSQQLRSKYNSMQCQREGVKMYLIRCRNRFKPGELSLSRDKILQRDWTKLNSAAGHGLYTQFTRPFPFLAEVGLAWETNIVAYQQFETLPIFSLRTVSTNSADFQVI